MSRMTGGEVLVRCLLKEGVRYVFGVPGAQLLPLTDAIFRNRERGIDFIHNRHEQASAHMADAWARVTGQPGICAGTVGPGATDLVPGVAVAYVESIPIVVLTAQTQSWRAYPSHGSTQECDQLGLFSSITKWNAVVNSWDRICELVRQAFRVALSGRPGPVHLDLPADVLFQTGEIEEDAFLEPYQYRAVDGPGADPALVEKAVELLLSAQAPLIHAGGGVLRAGAWNEVRELAEYLGALVTPTVGSRGVVPDDHPQVFKPSGYGAIGAQCGADVVLAVGARFGELDCWGQPPFWCGREGQKIIQVDRAAEMIGVNTPVELGIVGDARIVLRQIVDLVKRSTGPRKASQLLTECRATEETWMSEFEELAGSDKEPIHPLRLIKEARDFFPRDSIVCVDGGNIAVWASYLMHIYEPRSFMWAGDMGHLGVGLPYALAAKLACPEKQVFIIHGDGSFMFMNQELETARRHELRIVDIIANDQAYGMIKQGQLVACEGRVIGVDFYDTRCDKMAESMGCYGERVEKPEQIRPALQRAVDSGLPAVLDVLVDKEPALNPPDFVTLVDLWLQGCEM
ncbi:MAG: thiamine pyrophosphate-binding protein [Dehalococcoidia bacterium]|nr:thiamine pyrophosphate-binding protein [Dehalococcoidia bacterium]